MSRSQWSSRRMRGVWITLILTSAMVLAVRGSWAELAGPNVNDRHVARAVVSLLKEDHLTRHELNDEISERCLASFLKSLDPAKVYFYQSDIDAFNKQKDNIDDMLAEGRIDFAYTVFTTFLKRVDERVKMVDELLAQTQDFSTDEDIVVEPDVAKYPKNEADARDLWRRRIKYDLLVQKADKKTDKEAHDKITRRYHGFEKRMHQLDHDELLEMFLSSLTTSYDPHSQYMSPSTLENFEIQMRLNLEGIGAALQFEDGYTEVSKIIPGGAAFKEGHLKKDDRIIGVGEGVSGEIVNVVDMKLQDVVARIRGKRGTTVRLQVIPAGKTEPEIYNIVRAQIDLTDSEARGEVIEEKRDGVTYKIGVIDLPSFYMDMEGARKGTTDFKSTTRDVSKILKGFKEKHVDAVVLDLRRNGGGALTEAINLTGLFIDEGPVVQVKGKKGGVQVYDDLERGTEWDGPLVVLISKFSASASEILAGAIQDYGRGLIVGDEATHGKGTVQSLLDLGQRLFRLPGNTPKLGALKITMQQFYRPNGDSTQNRGVLSDVELPSLTTHLDVGESDLDFAVPFDHVDPATHKKVNMVSKAILAKLNGNSEVRRKDSSDWQKVLRNITRYEEQKSRKTVTLNEKKFLEERAELNADKEQEKEIEELNDPNKPVVVRNFYFNEVLEITIDYLQSMRLARAR
jgi:carboxyl-terminal processing protease